MFAACAGPGANAVLRAGPGSAPCLIRSSLCSEHDLSVQAAPARRSANLRAAPCGGRRAVVERGCKFISGGGMHAAGSCFGAVRRSAAAAPGRLGVLASSKPERIGDLERFDFNSKDFVRVQVRGGDFVSPTRFVAVLEEVDEGRRFQPRVVQERVDRAYERQVLPVFMNAFEGRALAEASRSQGEGRRGLEFYASLVEHLWRARSLVTAVLDVAEGVAGPDAPRRNLPALFAGLAAEVRRGAYGSHHEWLLGLLRPAGFSVFQVALTGTSRPDEVTACVFLEGPEGRNLFCRALPSDALALAARAACPIFVARDVWADAAFAPVGTTAAALAVLGGAGAVPASELAASGRGGGGARGGRLGGVGALDPAAERPSPSARPRPARRGPAGRGAAGRGRGGAGGGAASVVEVFRDEAGTLRLLASGPEEGVVELARETALGFLNEELERAVAEERYEEAGRLVREEPLLRLSARLEAAVRDEDYAAAAAARDALDDEARRLLERPAPPPPPPSP
eukprot:tig00001623_g9423.t1